MFRKISTLILVLLAGTLFAAADSTSYNTATYVEIGAQGTDYVLFYGQSNTTIASDSVGIHYTKAMRIADFQVSTQYAHFFIDGYNSATGTEDCNVTVEFSFDLTTWVVGAANSGVIKDQLSTTAIMDTLNVFNAAEDTNFPIYPYMRLKFDFQASNPIGMYVWWKIRLQKPTNPEVWYQNKNSLITSY